MKPLPPARHLLDILKDREITRRISMWLVDVPFDARRIRVWFFKCPELRQGESDEVLAYAEVNLW